MIHEIFYDHLGGCVLDATGKLKIELESMNQRHFLRTDLHDHWHCFIGTENMA